MNEERVPLVEADFEGDSYERNGHESAVPLSDHPEGEIIRFYEMIADGTVDEARSFIRKLQSEWPDSERARNLARVFAPPIARVVESKIRPSFREDRCWIKENAHQYPGMWLSVCDGRLICVHEDLKEVRLRTKKALGDKKALLYFQPED